MLQQTKDYRHSALISSSAEVQEGKGKNIIPPPERESLWKAYLDKFKDPIIVVLLVVFLFSVVVALYEIFVVGKGFDLLLEPSGVLVALLLATGVGFVFEVKAGREFDVLNKVKDSRPVKVLRREKEGAPATMMTIPKQDVVVGDIVCLESGDEIPADGYLVDTLQLRVDESNFTGETYANKYLREEDFDLEATYPSNFLLRGSTVIEGRATMRVSSIGVDTEEGRGVTRASEGSDVETPLNAQLAQLGRWISTASFIIASLIIVGRIISLIFFDPTPLAEYTFVEIAEFALATIMIAVTLIVVAVPEGLPMSITVSLALSMRRMLKEKSLVRKLHACETMGAATVICTDKTGTLTKNRMTVVKNLLLDESFDDVFKCCMAVNSTAELGVQDGAEVVIGNPTEGALIKWLQTQGVDYRQLRDRYAVVEQQPFSTETKFMSSLVEDMSSGKRLRLVKGAPEIVMSMCSKLAGGVSREDVEQKLRQYQSCAMRTLGFAVQCDDNEELMFIGIVGIADPIRDDVKEAIDIAMSHAGVRVIIVTGDTPGTAAEIGRQLGLIEGVEGEIITGPEFARLGDDEARELLRDKRLKIIARARPDDKARLVMLLQANGEVVAVTGDGTNDAPALSKAQVGLSMGDGTSRAKEASDITIIDNSFASINKAIMWGRSLYLNIRRFIIFQMTINLSACLIVLFGAFVGLESPLTVTQMLWVNLIMDTFAAMALSSLPADRGVLNEPPRKPQSHIINRPMLRRIAGFGLVFFVVLVGLWQLLHHVEISSVADIVRGDTMRQFVADLGTRGDATDALTRYELGVFFSIFVVMQFWNMFNAKYFHSNRCLMLDIVDLVRRPAVVRESYSLYFVLIALVILLGQVLIVNFAGDLFGVAPLPISDWAWILLLTSPILFIPDILRLIRR